MVWGGKVEIVEWTDCQVVPTAGEELLLFFFAVTVEVSAAVPGCTEMNRLVWIGL